MTAATPAAEEPCRNLPPKITWRVEVDEGDRWRHVGPTYPSRDLAVSLRAELRARRRAWADGEPVRYRLVREVISTWIEEDQ